MKNIEDIEKVEKFLNNYNLIDKFLRNTLNKEKESSFSSLVEDYSRNYISWAYKDILKSYGYLRNLLEHERTKEFEYIAIPSLETINQIEKIYSEFTNPVKIYPKFQCPVISVKLTDTIFYVLQLIKENSFSQFPVYDENNNFIDFLTEKSITEWLSEYVTENSEVINFNKDATVKKVIEFEGIKDNYKFVSTETLLEHVDKFFFDDRKLEAVLITQNGKENETLLGIITSSDILRN